MWLGCVSSALRSGQQELRRVWLGYCWHLLWCVYIAAMGVYIFMFLRNEGYIPSNYVKKAGMDSEE